MKIRSGRSRIKAKLMKGASNEDYTKEVSDVYRRNVTSTFRISFKLVKRKNERKNEVARSVFEEISATASPPQLQPMRVQQQ